MNQVGTPPGGGSGNGPEVEAGLPSAVRTLEEHQQLLAALWEHGAGAVVLCDPATGRIVDFNSVAHRELGYTREDFALLRVADLRPEPADSAPLFGWPGSASLPSPAVRFSTQVRHRLGALREVDLVLQPLTWKGRALVLSTWRDVTERKEGEDRLRALTESARDAILMMDPQGDLSFWNRAAQEILGYRAEEVLGRNLHDLLAPERYREAYRAAFPRFLEGGQGAAVGRTVELEACRKDGREIHVSLSLSAVHLEGGWHAVGILRDVSEVKRYQAELVAAAERAEEANRAKDEVLAHLEDLVASRTAELESARAEAESANQAKSSFLANMSHEIRTPMNAILGFAHLLRSDPLTPRQADQLEKMSLSAQHLLRVLNDILDLSKIEARRMELEVRDFELAEALEHVCAQVSERAQVKGVRLQVELSDRVPPVLKGDGHRVGQVLLNLVSNAVKFTDQGSVSLSVRVLDQSSQAVFLRFEVRDTGIGMGPEELERVFQAFEQADASTTRRFGGSGLGLSISRSLVEMMGGAMGVESEAGQGSTFWVELPFEVSGSLQGPRGPGPEDLLAELGRRRGARILLVEDNAINLEVALGLLEAVGMEVGTAENGLVALEKARAGGYHLVLMDVQMPVMDGLEATRALRGLPGFGSLPIVAMTAEAFEEDEARCREAGMDCHLAKPVEPRRLYEALVHFLPALGEEPAAWEPAPGGPGSAAERSLLSGLEKVRGLEASRGLRSLLGDVPSYARLLGAFAHQHGQDALLLSGHLASHDREGLARTAHALRGVAGTLGALGIEKAAAALERALAAGESPDRLQGLVAQVASRLDLLVGDLRRALPEPGLGPEAVEVDREALDRVLARLDVLLASDDVEANHLFEKEKGLLLAAFGEKARRLGLHLQDFDYAEALEAVRAARAELGQPGS